MPHSTKLWRRVPCSGEKFGNCPVDVPPTRGHIMDRIANADVLEIEMTSEVLRAGVVAMSKYDERFEPPDMAVVRILRSILETALPMSEARVVLAPDVERFLSPYLKSEERTLSY